MCTTLIYTTQLQGETNEYAGKSGNFWAICLTGQKLFHSNVYKHWYQRHHEKNLRQAIENKNQCYKFVNIEMKMLIYPMSLVMDTIGTKYYRTFLQLQNLQSIELKGKKIS